MPAKVLDLRIEQGATFDLDFVWADTALNPDGSMTQVPKDLAGCKARMQVRAGYGRDILLEATTENGRILLADGGEVRIVLDAVTTDEAPLYISMNAQPRIRRRAVYDLEVVWPDGRVDRVLEGKVAFSPNITRDPPPGT